MKLSGLQKTTLLDFPGKVACTVFTAGCNFRCPFCHNATLVLGEGDPIDTEEFFRFLKKRQGILDGVCITGGEPTLQKDLRDFIFAVKELGYAVKLDTNGNRPGILSSLLEEGLLDYVAMDVKNAPGFYAETVGISGFCEEAVWESVDLLRQGKTPFEFRTTVTSELHSPERILLLAQRIKGDHPYYIQQFRPSEDLLSPGSNPVSPEDLQRMLEGAKRYLPKAALRGGDPVA